MFNLNQDVQHPAGALPRSRQSPTDGIDAVNGAGLADTQNEYFSLLQQPSLEDPWTAAYAPSAISTVEVKLAYARGSQLHVLEIKNGLDVRDSLVYCAVVKEEL
ncbi:MAG: hypothetical protein MMC33_003229 [Icmadophila ericetorum]|nr:hypothetical protein [Icmadophila ericetorum]